MGKPLAIKKVGEIDLRSALNEAATAEKDVKAAEDEALLAKAEAKKNSKQLRRAEQELRILQTECKYEVERKKEMKDAKKVILKQIKNIFLYLIILNIFMTLNCLPTCRNFSHHKSLLGDTG